MRLIPELVKCTLREPEVHQLAREIKPAGSEGFCRAHGGGKSHTGY